MSNPYGEVIHEVKPNPWKLGVVYADSADRRLIVRQRIGLGWTLNLGHPLAWAMLTAIVAAGIVRRRRRV